MNKNSKIAQSSSVPSKRYTSEYFRKHSDGYKEFQNTEGRHLPTRLKAALDLAEIEPGMMVLDVGCGRGEILYHSYLQGANTWGMDYSKAAIQIVNVTFNKIIQGQYRTRIHLQRANSTRMPYANERFDIVFLLDIVEHLNPYELEQTLKEISMVLKKDGKLIIHTMPNLWYYRFGYPLYRAFQFIRGIKLPKDPRDRWEFKDVHINEQTPRSLLSTLRQCGYDAKVRTTSVMTYPNETHPAIRSGMIFLSRAPILRLFLGNDIFAIAKKK